MADWIYPFLVGGPADGKEVPDHWLRWPGLYQYQDDLGTGKVGYECGYVAFAGAEPSNMEDGFYYAAPGRKDEAESRVRRYREEVKGKGKGG